VTGAPTKESGSMSTILLGSEFDQELRDQARCRLREIGATVMGTTLGVGGSQELSVEEWSIGDARVVLTAETYMGLSLGGPAAVVDRVSTALGSASSKST
jgi:hypothetical protein